MKTLFLVRHASAEINAMAQDIERNLDETGKREAAILGEHFAKLKVKPQSALVSPANRTMQTFEKAFNQNNGAAPIAVKVVPKLYNAHYLTILEQVQQTDDAVEHLLVVAHNPGLSQLASFICKQDNGFQLPTSGMLMFQSKANKWSELKDGSCKLIQKWY
jgi:phosphohistidine phosphatase